MSACSREVAVAPIASLADLVNPEARQEAECAKKLPESG